MLDLLLPAVPAGLVELAADPTASVGATAGSAVRFGHALVRDAVYAALSPQRLSELHRRAAEILEPLATGRDERAGTVAQHWTRAGVPSRALPWAIRAAETARAAADYEEAISYLELALGAVDRVDATGVDGIDNGDGVDRVDRAELLLDLARMQYLGGHLEPSLQTCRVAAEEGDRTGRSDVVARAALTVQGIGHPEANVAIAQLCRRALAMLGKAGLDFAATVDLRARVQAQLACALVELDLVDEAECWADRALADAGASGDGNAELDAIRARVMLRWRPADDDEVHALGGRAMELAEGTGRTMARLWAHAWRSDVAVRRVDLAAAHSEMDHLQNLAERTGLPLVRWHLLRRQASLAALRGDFEGCRLLGRQAMAVAESWGDDSVRYTHLAQTVNLALLRGDPTDVDPQWVDRVRELDGKPPVARAVVASALLLVGRVAEARAMYESLVSTLASARTIHDAAVVSYLYYLSRAFRDIPACARIRDWMAAELGAAPAVGGGAVFYFGSLARMLGQLDLATNDPAAAVAHFQDGLAVDDALGARPYVAEGCLGLARALVATGDTAAAIAHARHAAAAARRLDMPDLVRAADRLLAGAAAKARAADPLTRREREVLALIAQALSNREVASILVLSERTVESHVRNILAKTGLTKRVQLVRWYHERDTRE